MSRVSELSDEIATIKMAVYNTYCCHTIVATQHQPLSYLRTNSCVTVSVIIILHLNDYK